MLSRVAGGLAAPAGAGDAALGPRAAEFLARTAALWQARARAIGARVHHGLEMEGQALRWEWTEAGGPPGDLGPPDPPQPHPPGMRVRRVISPGSLGVMLDLPPAARDW